VLAEGQFDVCFHLAAQVEVGVAITNPYTTFEANIRGTYTLLDAIRRLNYPMKAIVVASSDKSYGSYPPEMMPYREDYPLRPRYPYDTSKACADLIAQSYANDIFQLPIVITRFSNIFGPGQLNFSALVPDLIRSALGHTSFTPRGNGTSIRDFIFSEDVILLYTTIAERLAQEPIRFRGNIYNAGTGEPRTVKEVVDLIFGLIGSPTELEQIQQKMGKAKTSGEIDVQYMDYQSVERDFQWRPTTEFNDGIEKTIRWYRNYFQSKTVMAR
jgi:CDP-glucose 4,6-dehydratase